MKFPKRRHRLVVECLTAKDIRHHYECLKPPRGWSKMGQSELRKFLTLPHRWEVTTVVDMKYGITESVVNINTPTTLKEANHAIKQIIDAVLDGEKEVYYAKVTALVV